MKKIHMRHTMIDMVKTPSGADDVRFRRSYLCATAVKANPDKLSSCWGEVTCQNCLIIGKQMSRFKEVVNNGKC